jgi:adenine-specific DNA-methyltransferase
VKKIEIVAYEDAPTLTSLLEKSLEFAKKWLAERGIKLKYDVIEKDFILDNSQGLWAKKVVPYDLTIGNPPYFKIGKGDPRAVSSARYVYGQPNIYALFMGVAAELLRDEGLMVFITPRSYAAGPYFKLFREKFFKMMCPERVHLFGSRTNAFKKDEVLQENIILKAKKSGKASMVKISASDGIEDLHKPISHDLLNSRVLHSTEKDLIFRLPVSDFDIEIIDIVEKWQGSLHKYSLEISTGPVVPFRAEELIFAEKQGNIASAPLIWMQNVQTMKVEWPMFGIRNGKPKPQYIKANKEAIRRKLLIEDQNAVLLRRFSAKEEHRRLVAAPLFKGQLDAGLIGLENHLNYIYQPIGKLSQTRTLGLSASLCNG